METFNYLPIFEYIDKWGQNFKLELKEELKAELASKQEVSELKTAVASLAYQVKTYHEELLISTHRLDRLEGWAGPVGDKLNLPIKF